MAKEYDPFLEFAGAMTDVLAWVEKQKSFSDSKVDPNAEKTLQQLENLKDQFQDIVNKMAAEPAKEKKEQLTEKRQRVLDQLEMLKSTVRLHRRALKKAIEQEKAGTDTQGKKPTKKQVRRRRKKLKKAGGKGGWLKT